MSLWKLCGGDLDYTVLKIWVKRNQVTLRGVVDGLMGDEIKDLFNDGTKQQKE